MTHVQFLAKYGHVPKPRKTCACGRVGTVHLSGNEWECDRCARIEVTIYPGSQEGSRREKIVGGGEGVP